jgi:DNA-binding beta-propeller fold protein YncE
LSPDDKTLYVFYPGTVAAYSADNGAMIKPMLLVDGLAPGWATITADGKKMYAINALSSNVAVIDTQAWKVTKSIFQPLTALPLSGTLTPDGSKLYLCNIGTYNMTIINTSTDTIEKIIPTLYTPIYVSFNATGTEAYLSNLGPLTNLPPLARPILFDFFYFLPPGIPGNITTYDVASGTPKGVTVTGNGPVVGVYF